MSGFKNFIAEYSSNFHRIYHKEIAPIMSGFESRRKLMLLTLVLYEIILIISAYFSFKYWFKQDDSWIVLAALVAIGSLVAIFLLPPYFNSKFTHDLKMSYIRRIVAAFGDMKWFPKTNIIPDSQLNQSDLFGEFNTRASDDAFSGCYKDVEFAVCETELKFVSGSGRNKQVQNIFKGVIINFKSNKIIKNKTLIATKGDKNIMRRNGAIWLSLLSVCLYDINYFWQCLIIAFIVYAVYMFYQKYKRRNEEVLNEIKLEDPKFNKKYKAYSSDEVEGRYLITPAFMERFNNVKTSFGVQNIKCSFYGDSLMFAITTNKNVFEVGSLFVPVNSPRQMEKFFNELVSILLLVDYFKLEQKTGL